MKKYIVYNDCQIGYIKDVCACARCKERGRAEIFINTLEDEYLDCIKVNEIEEVIYLGNNLQEAIDEMVGYLMSKIKRQQKENRYLQELIDFYSKLKDVQ